MDVFGHRNLRRLIGVSTSPCVSLYLPTHVAGDDGQQDPIRLKNLLQQTEEELAEKWLRPPAAAAMLRSLRESSATPAFWRKRSQGLAVFLAPDVEEVYRLPIAFDEQVSVDDRFHVLPVLPMASAGEHFFVLTLSQNGTRLYSATRYEMEQVHIPDLPANMRDTLNYSYADRGSQVHSAMRGSGGKQAAVFHGQGGQADTHKDDVAMYFRHVDNALRPVLRDETSPMLLAGVEYLLPIFRSVSTYPHLAAQELRGNWDRLTSVQLLQLAWPTMANEFDRTRRNDVARFQRWIGTGRATGNINEIVAAAFEGRVETLFADVQGHYYGVFDQAQLRCEMHSTPQEGDADLLEVATRETLLHRGTVYSVARDGIPGGDVAAALLRY